MGSHRKATRQTYCDIKVRPQTFSNRRNRLMTYTDSMITAATRPAPSWSRLPPINKVRSSTSGVIWGPSGLPLMSYPAASPGCLRPSCPGESVDEQEVPCRLLSLVKGKYCSTSFFSALPGVFVALHLCFDLCFDLSTSTYTWYSLAQVDFVVFLFHCRFI